MNVACIPVALEALTSIMYTHWAISQAAESNMFKFHLPWSQQRLKIEYLMTTELQRFQKFLSCTTSNGLSFLLQEYLNSESHPRWARWYKKREKIEMKP